MKIGKEIKRDAQLIILSVILLTIVTLSVSYSAFFSVQSLSTIQEISTGNLDVSVTVDNTKSILNSEKEIFPSTVAEVTNETTGSYSILTLLNEGSLDADFSVTLSYDFEKMRTISGFEELSEEELINNLVSLKYLKIGIYDDIYGNWINFGTLEVENLYPTVSSLVPSTEDANAYPILRDTVFANSTENEQFQRRFKIYIWLSEDTPTSEIGKYVFLKINVKCAAGDETITEEVESVS